jgi:hypothetical protein
MKYYKGAPSNFYFLQFIYQILQHEEYNKKTKRSLLGILSNRIKSGAAIFKKQVKN